MKIASNSSVARDNLGSKLKVVFQFSWFPSFLSEPAGKNSDKKNSKQNKTKNKTKPKKKKKQTKSKQNK